MWLRGTIYVPIHQVPSHTYGCGQLCLREGAVQQGDEPNERRKRDFLGGFGGMLPLEFSRITLSKTAFYVF